MKHILLSISAVLLFVAPGEISAQPILTATGINPVVGDQINFANAQYVNPGSGGANQTWNLGFTSTGTGTNTVVAPSTTPYASSFTNANVAWNGGGIYSYYATSSSALTFRGTVNPQGTIISYSDYEDQMRYPMSYNTTYTDSWSGTFVQSTYTYYRWGSTTVTADGYGTLTTPAGTFSNVMRVHFVQDYKDSANIMSMPVVITYYNDQYMWYLNGNHYPIASEYTFTMNSNPAQASYYVTNVVSSVQDELFATAVSMYPNPTDGAVNLDITVTENSIVAAEIFSAEGKLLSSAQYVLIPGENRIRLDIEDFEAGYYFVAIRNKEAVISVQRLIRN